MRVLVVEAEPFLARQFRQHLCGRLMYAVDLAETGLSAFDLMIEVEYDLVVLDPQLGDGCGLDLLRGWREEEVQAPVLVVSKGDSVDDKVQGFEAGADDYLVRPFAWEEFQARVQTLLKRRRAPRIEQLKHGCLVLDRARSQVIRHGAAIALTAKEFGLLEYLMLHPDRVISRMTLAEHVWDNGYRARSNVVEVTLARLRRKLEAGGKERLIVTVKGMGYRLRKSRENVAVP